MLSRYHRGVNPCLNPAIFFLCNGKEFYLIAKLPGKLYIQRSNLAYALSIDIRRFYMRAISQIYQNRKLMRCIYPLHIVCRVCLCITLFLRLLEHILKPATLICHFAQDVTCCTVYYAIDGVYPVGNKTFLQCLYNRYAATHACLKSYVHIVLCRSLKNLFAVL